MTSAKTLSIKKKIPFKFNRSVMEYSDYVRVPRESDCHVDYINLSARARIPTGLESYRGPINSYWDTQQQSPYRLACYIPQRTRLSTRSGRLANASISTQLPFDRVV